jgi:hypothetical protein
MKPAGLIIGKKLTNNKGMNKPRGKDEMTKNHMESNATEKIFGN